MGIAARLEGLTLPRVLIPLSLMTIRTLVFGFC